MKALSMTKVLSSFKLIFLSVAISLSFWLFRTGLGELPWSALWSEGGTGSWALLLLLLLCILAALVWACSCFKLPWKPTISVQFSLKQMVKCKLLWFSWSDPRYSTGKNPTAMFKKALCSKNLSLAWNSITFCHWIRSLKVRKINGSSCIWIGRDY